MTPTVHPGQISSLGKHQTIGILMCLLLIFDPPYIIYYIDYGDGFYEKQQMMRIMYTGSVIITMLTEAVR